MLIMPDVVQMTAECAIRDVRYVSTLPFVSDYAVKTQRCSDHVRVDHAVTHECYVDPERKRGYDDKLCNLIDVLEYETLDFGRVPDDSLSSVQFAKFGYNIGLLFLSQTPSCWGEPEGPPIRMPWYSDFTPFFNTIEGPITSGVIYHFDEYFPNHPDHGTRTPSLPGPTAGDAMDLHTLRAAEADLLTQRAGIVSGGNGMWLSARSRSKFYLHRSDGRPFVISYDGEPVVLGLYHDGGQNYHAMVSVGAYTRWIFKHLESRLVARSQHPMEMIFARYLPRPIAEGQMQRKANCECTDASMPSSNGFDVGDRVGCAAFVPGEPPFCYVTDAECRGATLHYSQWQPGAYWMSCDPADVSQFDNALLISSAASRPSGVAEGAVCPVGHRYMTIEECLAREDPCGPGEIRSESTFACVASIFRNRHHGHHLRNGQGLLQPPLFLEHCANTCLHGEAPYVKCVQTNATTPTYSVQRGTRCDPRAPRTQHSDRLGASSAVEVDIFEDGTVAGTFHGSPFGGAVDEWLPHLGRHPLPRRGTAPPRPPDGSAGERRHLPVPLGRHDLRSGQRRWLRPRVRRRHRREFQPRARPVEFPGGQLRRPHAIPDHRLQGAREQRRTTKTHDPEDGSMARRRRSTFPRRIDRISAGWSRRRTSRRTITPTRWRSTSSR